MEPWSTLDTINLILILTLGMIGLIWIILSVAKKIQMNKHRKLSEKQVKHQSILKENQELDKTLQSLEYGTLSEPQLNEISQQGYASRQSRELDRALQSFWKLDKGASFFNYRLLGVIPVWLVLMGGILLSLILLNTNVLDSWYQRMFATSNITIIAPSARVKVEAVDPSSKGDFQIVFLLKNNNSFLQSSEDIQKIEIHYPNNEIKLVAHDSPVENGNGYVDIGQDPGKRLWVYSESYNIQPSGDYLIQIVFIDGTLIQDRVYFNKQEGDPITGFPINIQFDPLTKMISWLETQGQTGYRVMLFKGEKPYSMDLSQRIFTTSNQLITTPHYALPDSIHLESGQVYYIIVDANDSIDGSNETINYLHRQNQENTTFTY